jgi:hypothetical protein
MNCLSSTCVRDSNSGTMLNMYRKVDKVQWTEAELTVLTKVSTLWSYIASTIISHVIFRLLIQAIAMTACDLSASAKPWDVQVKTVKVIFEEFYEQVRRILLLQYFLFYIFKSVSLLQYTVSLLQLQMLTTFIVFQYVIIFSSIVLWQRTMYCKSCHTLNFI